LVQIDEDPWQLGKSYPVDVGLVADTRAGLAELREILDRDQTPARVKAAQAGAERWARRCQESRAGWEAKGERPRQGKPLTALGLMGAVARVFPPRAVLVEEAATTTNHVLEHLGVIKDPVCYFGHRGWALGWGLGCALGVKLAWPDRPVLAVLGEGAAMYGIQGLWTAARYRLGVTFVICNNAHYQILKSGAAGRGLPAAHAGKV